MSPDVHAAIQENGHRDINLGSELQLSLLFFFYHLSILNGAFDTNCEGDTLQAPEGVPTQVP